jgi:hypothetical protein
VRFIHGKAQNKAENEVDDQAKKNTNR